MFSSKNQQKQTMQSCQLAYDLALPEEQFEEPETRIDQELFNKYVEQLMTTGTCPELFGDDDEPARTVAEAREIVAYVMELDLEINRSR